MLMNENENYGPARIELKVALNTLVGVVIAFLVLLPFFWMILTSLKTPEQLFKIPFQLFPEKATLQNYVSVWRDYPFVEYFVNSVVVCIVTAVAVVSTSSLAAYGFARFHFKGQSLVEMVVLTTQMIPVIVVVIPMFKIIRNIGLYDTQLGLIISYTSVTLPFCIWMMKSFVENIPKEIDLAAMIDGCTRLQAFWKAVFPLMLPGLVATTVFTFLESWNLYLIPLVLSSEKSIPLTVGIAGLISEHKIDWGQIMAASTVASVPSIILFLIFERYLIANLTAGAVKQ
ncbi:carbohydrate ABC transporter membrane protein 2 (CUT1 family) [Hydrogenispora ethanolica]|uniref:Carbohydrate ABC transporter membrane protein 2 (CUT1 family) n=2 Tax=Hydrogenispora ethanolica TaxID=1082276 RepID=A0A4R1SBP6_HYDET|nr:carbohydrate ABC transporter membrane protein 2 (CUT1 family) [Hydrogenispora ethanolica]